MEVSARHVYRMVRVARDLGVTIPPHRVPPHRLDAPPDPLERIDVERACDLVEWLQDERGLVELGVEAGQVEDPAWLDPGALVVAVRETLRAGLRRAASYWALWASRRCHRLVDTERGAEWRFVPPGDLPPRAARAAFEELTMTQMTVGLSRAAGRPIRPVSVRFAHLRTAHAGRLEALSSSARWSSARSARPSSCPIATWTRRCPARTR